MVLDIGKISNLKTLNIKDPHFRGTGFKAPAGRDPEDFEKDINSKVDQIVDICLKEGIHLITISGDLNDIKETARYTKNQIMPIYKILQRLKDSTILKLIITISGNHDLPNSSRQMKSKSVYHMFQELGVITDVSDARLELKCKGFIATFKGFDYVNRLSVLNSELKNYNQTLSKEKRGYLHTVLIHEHLLKKSDLNKNESRYLGNRFTYGYVNKKYPNINCFVAGHYHKGYPTFKFSNGTVIINNWNLTRLSRNYYVLNGSHTPNVVIAEYSANGIGYRDIPLKVRDYINIISEADVVEDSYNINEFLDKINQSKVSEDNSTDIILNSRQKSLLEEILEESKTEIQE